MRRAARTDGNQTAIASALLAAGCSVHSLAAVGDGLPDLLVGVERSNILLECKDPAQPPSKRRFTAAQKKWHAEWKGTAHVVETIEQALAVIEFYRGKRRAA